MPAARPCGATSTAVRPPWCPGQPTTAICARRPATTFERSRRPAVGHARQHPRRAEVAVRLRQEKGRGLSQPTAGIKVGEHRHTVIGPLSPGELAGAITTATVRRSQHLLGQGGAAPPSPQPSEVSASTASSTRPSPTDPIPSTSQPSSDSTRKRPSATPPRPASSSNRPPSDTRCRRSGASRSTFSVTEPAPCRRLVDNYRRRRAWSATFGADSAVDFCCHTDEDGLHRGLRPVQAMKDSVAVAS